MNTSKADFFSKNTLTIPTSSARWTLVDLLTPAQVQDPKILTPNEYPRTCLVQVGKVAVPRATSRFFVKCRDLRLLTIFA